jgi:hypothetical protein
MGGSGRPAGDLPTCHHQPVAIAHGFVEGAPFHLNALGASIQMPLGGHASLAVAVPAGGALPWAAGIPGPSPTALHTSVGPSLAGVQHTPGHAAAHAAVSYSAAHYGSHVSVPLPLLHGIHLGLPTAVAGGAGYTSAYRPLSTDNNGSSNDGMMSPPLAQPCGLPLPQLPQQQFHAAGVVDGRSLALPAAEGSSGRQLGQRQPVGPLLFTSGTLPDGLGASLGQQQHMLLPGGNPLVVPSPLQLSVDLQTVLSAGLQGSGRRVSQPTSQAPALSASMVRHEGEGRTGGHYRAGNSRRAWPLATS